MTENHENLLDKTLSTYLDAVGLRGNIEAVKKAVTDLGLDGVGVFSNLDELLEKAKVAERKAFVHFSLEALKMKE